MFEFIHKTVSLKPSFRLSVEMWSRFSELVCFNWVWNEVFTSLILEKNIWTHAKIARVATPPQISSNLKFEISLQISSYLKFLIKSPLVSSKNVDFQKILLKSLQIKKKKIILSTSLLNNTNSLRLKAVKHNRILGHHGSISLYCLVI